MRYPKMARPTSFIMRVPNKTRRTDMMKNHLFIYYCTNDLFTK